MKKAKFGYLAVSLILSCALLAGCDGGGETSTTPTGSSSDTTTTTTTTEAETTTTEPEQETTTEPEQETTTDDGTRNPADRAGWGRRAFGARRTGYRGSRRSAGAAWEAVPLRRGRARRL